MSLSENTTALRNILAAVGELPTKSAVKLQEKSITPGSEAITVVPDAGYDGLSKVNVGASQGGVTVQRASGNVTTSRKGLATINCGFKPDLVVFYVSSYTSSGDLYENVIALPIAESKENSGADLNNIAWSSSSGNLIECWPESITSTGISCTFYGYDSSWNEGYASMQTYSWTAIKYTE